MGNGHGLMKYHKNLHARVDYCDDCEQAISQSYLAKGGRCRHCHSKKVYGTLDIETCFQGSVITMED